MFFNRKMSEEMSSHEHVSLTRTSTGHLDYEREVEVPRSI